jgi:peptide/nickel transport system permease protein
MRRTRLIAFRVVGLLVTLWIASILVFVLVRLVPGDPAAAIAGEGASREMVEAARQRFGLTEPLVVQYFRFATGAVSGDFGVSYRTGQPVLYELIRRFPPTLELATISLLIAVIVGVSTGTASASAGRAAGIVQWLTSASVGIPSFWSGLLLIILFYGALGWLPSGGAAPVEGLGVPRVTGLATVDALLGADGRAFGVALSHLALPALTLALPIAGYVARTTRSAVAETLVQPYITVARAKGLAEAKVFQRHALKHAGIPVLTVIGLAAGDLLGGAVLTETIFSWPGVGRFAVGSMLDGDYAIVTGFVLIMTFAYAVINLFVDVMIYFLDPRIEVT